MKKILAVTGTRADYGNLRPVLNAIQEDSELKLQLVVCGSHLLAKYGLSVREIIADRFPIFEKINNLSSSDKPQGRIESFVSESSRLLQVIIRAKPDFVLALGDREDPLSCAIICNYLKLPFLHISGGDFAVGNADDMIRHSISKIAHIHFVTNKDSGKRLIKMGEEAWRVFNVGLPAVDVIVNKLFTKKSVILERFNIDADKPTVIVLSHPVSSELESSIKQVNNIIAVASKFDVNLVVVYPNSDPGSGKIINNIKKLASKNAHLQVFPTLHHFDYLGLLNIASCLIGNSSSGIVESAYFGLPTLNVGLRETGRLQGGNVKYISSAKSDIEDNLQLCIYDISWRQTCLKAKRLYGNGQASVKIVEIIKNIKIDNNLLVKKNTY